MLINKHMPPRRSPLIFVVVFAAIIVAWLGLRAFLLYSPPGQLPQTAPASLLEMKGVILNGIGEKGRDWTLRADRVDISQDRSLAKVYQIHGCTLYSKKKPVATLQADNAVYNLWNRKMSVLGNVRIFNSAGQRMETSALTWEPYGSILKSAGKVIYKSRTGDAVADNLTLNLETRELTLTKPRIALWVGEIESLR